MHYNQIQDLAPLVANDGIAAGDVLWLSDNPLDAEALCVEMPALIARGVMVIDITASYVCYTLTASANPAEGGTVEIEGGETLYLEGDSATLQALPNLGWRFDHWEVNGTDMGDANPLTLTVDTDIDAVAVFIQTNCMLTVSITGNGTVLPVSGEYPCNSAIDARSHTRCGLAFRPLGRPRGGAGSRDPPRCCSIRT